MALSCKNSSGSEQVENNTSSQVLSEPVYPTLPIELHKKLYYEVELIDYIFNDLPFSMSQSEKPSIQSNIRYIGADPVTELQQDCKPIARQFFQVQGEIILEADVYYSEGCYYYIFFQEGEARYANLMTSDGIGFMQNIINQASKTAQSIGNQAGSN